MGEMSISKNIDGHPKLETFILTVEIKNYSLLEVVVRGKPTKAHGIRPNGVDGLRNTLRLDLGTLQNRDIGIRHNFLDYC